MVISVQLLPASVLLSTASGEVSASSWERTAKHSRSVGQNNEGLREGRGARVSVPARQTTSAGCWSKRLVWCGARSAVAMVGAPAGVRVGMRQRVSLGHHSPVPGPVPPAASPVTSAPGQLAGSAVEVQEIPPSSLTATKGSGVE
jgi:hypothetical protein